MKRDACTVGVSRAKPWNRRPLIGSSLNVRLATMLLDAGNVASSADALTLTEKKPSSRASRRSTCAVLPTLTTTPYAVPCAKSALDAMTQYVPGSKEPARNQPAPSQLTVRSKPLPTRVPVTVAPGMTAPSGPVTAPTMRPRFASNCARSLSWKPLGAAAATNASGTNSARRQRTRPAKTALSQASGACTLAS